MSKEHNQLIFFINSCYYSFRACDDIILINKSVQAELLKQLGGDKGIEY